jgi:malonate-semialdehyde dehydrogenase (acetylating)/methylmalonate-semialdehyde dehydrogenase
MSPSKSTNNEVNLRTFRYSADHTKPTEIYDVDNFIQGEFRPSASKDWIDVHDPAVNEVVTRVPQSTRDELEAAVASARNAFPLWRDTSIMKRQQIMFRLTQLIRDHMDIIAISITKEQGKTLADARGDVVRQLVESRLSSLARFSKWPRIWKHVRTENLWVSSLRYAPSISQP